MAKLALARMVNIGTSRNFSKILVVLLAATAETRPPLVHQVYIYIYIKLYDSFAVHKNMQYFQ
jgi:hypothetical protein